MNNKNTMSDAEFHNTIVNDLSMLRHNEFNSIGMV